MVKVLQTLIPYYMRRQSFVLQTVFRFCDASGKRNNGFYKTLPKMLEDAGLLYDENGDQRTAYNLRHYYAEERFRGMGYNFINLRHVG